MSLDVRRLEKARELASGIVQTQCPACAEGGSDRAGEHLRIYPDGRFGCCVYPKDREHRKRIFALAGDKAPRGFTVKITGGKSAFEPARSVTASLTGLFGTLGTAKAESISTSKSVSQLAHDLKSLASLTLGTLGTPVLLSRAYAREEAGIRHDDSHICKDIDTGVPSVPKSPSVVRLPCFTPAGTLIIPFDSPERFHWWKGGQSIADTRSEVLHGLGEVGGKDANAAVV